MVLCNSGFDGDESLVTHIMDNQYLHLEFIAGMNANLPSFVCISMLLVVCAVMLVRMLQNCD